jgi:hypothetical protein
MQLLRMSDRRYSRPETLSQTNLGTIQIFTPAKIVPSSFVYMDRQVDLSNRIGIRRPAMFPFGRLKQSLQTESATIGSIYSYV